MLAGGLFQLAIVPFRYYRYTQTRFGRVPLDRHLPYLGTYAYF